MRYNAPCPPTTYDCVYLKPVHGIDCLNGRVDPSMYLRTYECMYLQNQTSRLVGILAEHEGKA